MFFKRVARLNHFVSEFGVEWTSRFLLYRFAGGAVARAQRRAAHRALAETVRAHTDPRPPIVIKSTLDFRFPYDQRPHHLARALARNGRLVFFISRLSGYDQVSTSECSIEGVIVTPHLDLIARLCPSAALLILSTDSDVDETLVDAWPGPIVYDYVDAIDDSINSAPFSPSRLALHDRLLHDEERVICVASALSLVDEVAQHRTRRFALIENAVDISHFDVERRSAALTAEQRAVVELGKPIAGYFGALASWLDYPLILALARSRPEVSFVLIGIDYDGSASALRDAPENLYVLPPVPYARLPQFAAWFDVALLPFQVNEITQATSPLKLFEYMALGLPIVSTPIPEAKRYASVTVADGAVAFGSAISAALEPAHREARRRLARADARSNDWSARAASLADLIDASAGRPRSIAASSDMEARGLRLAASHG